MAEDARDAETAENQGSASPDEEVAQENDGEGDVAATRDAERLLLLEEYKLIQGKLDRIGDFRFRVKQWAITLVLGLIVGGAASPNVPGYLILVVGLLLASGFAVVEVFYDRQHKVLGARARHIERLFAKKKARGPSGLRWITTHVTISANSPALAASVLDEDKRYRRRTPRRAWLVSRPSLVFYGILLCILMGFALWKGIFQQGRSAHHSEEFRSK